jgi:hypothetical protein
MSGEQYSRTPWRKSSYSGNGGGNCVEVAVAWRKSSYSGNAGGNCVEVAVTEETSIAAHKADADKLYLMRDSKNPDGPTLAFTEAEWDAFVAGVKDGEFDLA